MANGLRVSLKAARVNVNLTQRQAAKSLGINVSTVKSYESGRTVPNWELVMEIENLYGLKAENIFLARNPL